MKKISKKNLTENKILKFKKICYPKTPALPFGINEMSDA